MSHVARVEVPGVLHIVEQRVRRDQRVPLEFHDRYLLLVTLCGSLHMCGVRLCAYNILPDRMLLAVIPEHSRAIGLALVDANRSFVRRFNKIHHQVRPFWQRGYCSCLVAENVTWPVLRYIDAASVQSDIRDPFDPRSLCSAPEHAGLPANRFLTAPRGRLPDPATWPGYLATQQDEAFVRALELCLRTGRPFGPFAFVRKVEQACGRHIRSACLNWPGLVDRTEPTAAGTTSAGPSRPTVCCSIDN